MSLMSLFRGGNVFKTAISVAPVTDWHFYGTSSITLLTSFDSSPSCYIFALLDTYYTERFMRTPQSNQGGYNTSSMLSYVTPNSKSFLLMHGLCTSSSSVCSSFSILLTSLLS